MYSNTPYIVWSPRFLTGIDLIDEQHRGLVSLINTFFYHKADADADLDRFLVPTAQMLKAYTKLHYMTLERIMRETGYPEEGIAKEATKHREILQMIEENDARCRAARDADGFLRFLKTYWQERDCVVKTSYIAFIRNYYEEHTS
jgi:hemerythrin-like metal-binding protein